MTGHVLLDTDVYSFLTRGDSRGEQFRKAVEGHRLCLSFATVAELYKGARKRGWSADREREGRRMEEFDAWIAATALRHAIPLATDNRRHFEGVPGLVLVEPRAV